MTSKQGTFTESVGCGCFWLQITGNPICVSVGCQGMGGLPSSQVQGFFGPPSGPMTWQLHSGIEDPGSFCHSPGCLHFKAGPVHSPSVAPRDTVGRCQLEAKAFSNSLCPRHLHQLTFVANELQGQRLLQTGDHGKQDHGRARRGRMDGGGLGGGVDRAC